jgi:Protein of unknown function (DUF3662)/FHA domain
MGLQQFERRLERLVEGVFAKAFRTSVRPVELGRRLTREMDLRRTVGVRGELIAPNHTTVALNPADHEALASFEDALRRDLADMAREHARVEGYSFLGPVDVELAVDEGLTPGMFLLTSEVREGPGGAPAGALVLDDGRRVATGDEPVTIGRLPECDVVLSDPNVSRRHAEVRLRDGHFVLVDLDSTNGTKVNGAGVNEHDLADGDQIAVGNAVLRFESS